MKRTVHPVILALAGALTLATAVAAQPAAGPVAVLVEAVFDAGEIAKGEKITHDFIVRNDGTAPLEITDVKPMCGCTVAEYDKLIAPGATGKVHAVIDTSTFDGGVAKNILVYTNDPANPRLQLTAKMLVRPYLYVSPGFARFIQPQGSEAGSVSQLVYTRDIDNLEITRAESPYPFLAVAYRPAKGDEPREDGLGKQWVLEFTLDYDKAPIGNLADWVTLHTNHPKQPVLKVPVSGFVRPMIAVTPPEADFGPVTVKSEPVVARMDLRSFAKEKFEITSAVANVPGVGVKVTPNEDGKRFTLEVTLGPDAPKGKLDGVITLKTTLAKKPVVEVPLKATVS